MNSLLDSVLMQNPSLLNPPRRSFASRLLHGIGGGLANIFTGAADPRLSDEQNNAIRNQALMQGGLRTIMAASQPGANGLASVAAGALGGQQFGDQARAQQAQGAVQQQQLLQLAMQLGLSPSVIASLKPEQIGELLKQQREGYTLAPGNVRFDAQGKQINAAPFAPKDSSWPAEMRLAAEALGIDVEKMDPKQAAAVMGKYEALKKAGATSVTMGGPQIFERAQNEFFGEAYKKVNTDAMSAENMLRDFGVMESALDAGLSTGRKDAMLSPIRGLAVSLGIAPEQTVRQMGLEPLFKSVANRMALLERSNMPGAMSDSDRRFLQEMAPRMANTVEGNRILIEVGKAVAERQILLADMFDQYVQGNGGSPVGWRTYMSKWNRAHQLDVKGIFKKYMPNTPVTW